MPNVCPKLGLGEQNEGSIKKQGCSVNGLPQTREAKEREKDEDRAGREVKEVVVVGLISRWADFHHDFAVPCRRQ